MMSRVHVDADKLDRLADAVGAKSGVPLKLTIDGMVDAVLSIEEGITPTGTKRITSNGKYDVAKFEQAEVEVKAPPIKTQAKTVIPTEYQRTVLPDSGYDGLSEVTVQPIVYNDLVLTPGTASEVYYSPRTTNSVTFLRRGVVIHAGEAPALEYSKSEQFDPDKTLHASLWCAVRPYQRESYEIQTDVLWVASDGMYVYEDDSISIYVNSSKLFVTNMLDVDVTLDIQFDAYCDAIDGVTLKGVKLQDISVTPTKQYQYLRPEQPNMGFENVTVQAIPSEYATVEPLSVTANGTYTAPSGTAYSPVTVNVEGGGGEGVGALLTEVSLGYISPSGTSEEDTGMTVTVSGINDYDMLIFAISSDTSSNSVHLETVTNVFLLASSDISTKDSYGIPGGRFNISRNASGIVRSKFYGTNYGVFPKNITITDGDMTSKIYARYSASYTGSIDGNYTCRVYGVNLCDMIGIQL